MPGLLWGPFFVWFLAGNEPRPDERPKCAAATLEVPAEMGAAATANCNGPAVSGEPREIRGCGAVKLATRCTPPATKWKDQAVWVEKGMFVRSVHRGCGLFFRDFFPAYGAKEISIASALFFIGFLVPVLFRLAFDKGK